MHGSVGYWAVPRQKDRERPEREKSGISGISGIGEHGRTRRMGVREAAETKEKRTGSATTRCLKNRQIVTVSLTLRAVLIKC